MTNELFRNHAITLIRTAVMQASSAAGINHAGLRGRVREITVENLLRPFLLGQFDIGTGKITDFEGNQSAETDIVIYSRNILPPIMYSERDGIFPIEACFYALEVKSKVTSEEIADSVQKAATLWQIKSLAPGNGIVPALFAFDTDLAVGGKSELETLQRN